MTANDLPPDDAKLRHFVPATPSPSVAPLTALDQPLTGRQKARLVGLVVLKRVRFIAVLAGVGMFIVYWDAIKNYWDKWTRPASAAQRELEAGQEFFCPMHPQVVRTSYEPNGDVPKCPICGMPLSVRKKGEAPPLPPGVTGRVQLTPERIQLAGVETVPIGYQSLSQQITTVGYVTYDEGRLSRVVSRIDGYVEKLFIDKTFTSVRAGDPLASIYSPELYSTTQELLLAAKGPAKDLAASARQRLRLLGVSDEEIDELVASGKATPRMLIRSPQHGYVMSKQIVAGSRVEPGMTLLEIADLSVVWIEADVFDKDVPLLRVGQQIEATVESLLHRVFAGKVGLIYPRVEAATRTVRVRFELENPQHELRPGMFATVRIDTPLETGGGLSQFSFDENGTVPSQGTQTEQPHATEVLAVPERAVIDTGVRQIVYVQRGPGLFEGVEVQLGPRVGGVYPVLKGLQAGDRVAAAGAFLIDAETRLNPAAASTYFGATGAPQSGAARATAPAGPPATGAKPARPSDSPPSGTPPAKPLAAPTELSPEHLENIAKLPPADETLALVQRACPITGAPLGSMGVPVKIVLKGEAVFLCCAGCRKAARDDADATLKKVAALRAARHAKGERHD